MERGRAHHTRAITGGGDGGSNPNGNSRGEPAAGFPLQWGNRKRLRCVKIQVKGSTKDKVDPNVSRRRNPESAAALAMRRTPQGQISGNYHGMTVLSEDKKLGDGGGVTSSGGSDDVVWPKFVISLSNREKEEDFMVFKGSNKLPQRPKKRAKCVQKTLNMVCPGSWLCDLTLERYEIREKKISKKRPRGLKAMGSMDSDSD